MTALKADPDVAGAAEAPEVHVDRPILAVFPEATIQTCIVHLLRHSLDFVSYKDRRTVAAALKDIYRAVDTGPSTPPPGRPR